MSIEFNRECFLTTVITCDEDGCATTQEFNAETGFDAIPLAIAAGWTIGARSGVKFDSCPTCTAHNNAAEPNEYPYPINLAEAL